MRLDLQARAALSVVAIGAAALAKIFIVAPSVVSFALAVVLAFGWTAWLDRHPFP